jgi:hypothetical protein
MPSVGQDVYVRGTITEFVRGEYRAIVVFRLNSTHNHQAYFANSDSVQTIYVTFKSTIAIGSRPDKAMSLHWHFQRPANGRPVTTGQSALQFIPEMGKYY